MFLRFHYGFANYFEISYQEEFHPVKYCLSRISTSRNIKFKRLQNSIFLAFGWFFKFCPQNLWHFEDVPIKCPKKFLYYIEFICRRTFEKKQVWILCLQLASPQNLDVFFGKFTVQQVLKSFSGRNNFQEPSIFECSDSLPYGQGIQKRQEISASNFFCVFELP